MLTASLQHQLSWFDTLYTLVLYTLYGKQKYEREWQW